jgi:NADH-quinone oxidoreductase subunit K
MMSLVHTTSVCFILFLLGISGIFLNRKNILVRLRSIELRLLAINLHWIFCSVSFDDLVGQVRAILILTVAAAESAIGLALFVIYFRVRGTIAVSALHVLRA